MTIFCTDHYYSTDRVCDIAQVEHVPQEMRRWLSYRRRKAQIAFHNRLFRRCSRTQTIWQPARDVQSPIQSLLRMAAETVQ